jgi:SPX domain protein involved in polyphosphate accumulation
MAGAVDFTGVLNLNRQASQNNESTLPTDLAADSFVRIEDKFFVTPMIQDKTIGFLESNMSLAFPKSGLVFTTIESVYFDSQNMDLFQHHFSRSEKRSKLRIRRYAPNGNWSSGSCFIEAKTKVKKDGVSVCSKERFKLDEENLQSLISQNPIVVSQTLMGLNAGLSEQDLSERVERVNEMVREYNLVPQMRVTYERLAFEGKESDCTESVGMRGGIRVTLDRGIRIERLTPFKSGISQALMSMGIWAQASELGRVFSNQETMIMEVKHRGILPNWLKEYLSQESINKVSFSKYCWGVAQQVQQGEE